MTTKKYIDMLQFKFESSNLIFCFTKKTMKFPKIKNVTTKWLTVVGGSETNLIQEEEEIQRQRVQGKNEVISYPRGTFIYHLIREIYIGELLGCFPQYVMILMLSHLPVNLSSNSRGCANRGSLSPPISLSLSVIRTGKLFLCFLILLIPHAQGNGNQNYNVGNADEERNWWWEQAMNGAHT